MKRIILLVVLVVLAGIAGIIARSHSRAELGELVSESQGEGSTRDEIRKEFELAPGAQVEIAGLNGSVKIETADTKVAQIYIERTASSAEALNRREVTIEATANSLRIRGEKRHSSFWGNLFGSANASERATLKLPRQISLITKGINGKVTVGAIDGSIEVTGVNGRVEIAKAAGSATFKGINGNISVSVERLDMDGVTLAGINGNIELQLPADVNADLEAKGMNGRVTSDLPNVSINEPRHGFYTARIGSGGSAITAKGINGNIRLTRPATDAPAASVGN